jgi:DNA-directed RNA polymerase subunit RPC12/RpoP
MENVFQLSGFLRRKHEPVFYDVTCPQCGFAEEFEFDPHHDTVAGDAPAKAERTVLRAVADLPAACPHCGSKLKKIRRPLFLRY